MPLLFQQGQNDSRNLMDRLCSLGSRLSLPFAKTPAILLPLCLCESDQT